MLSFFPGEERCVLIFTGQNGPNMNLTGQGTGSAVFSLLCLGLPCFCKQQRASASNGFHMVFIRFHMGFIRFSYGFQMIFQMAFKCFHMVFIWFVRVLSVVVAYVVAYVSTDSKNQSC